MERLTRPPTPARDPEPLPQRPVSRLSQDALAESAARLCNGAMDRRKLTIEQLESRFLVDPRPKTSMTSEERDASLQRLYYGAMKTSQTKQEQLRAKLLHQRITNPDKEKADHSIESLYTKQKERDAERQRKLYAKYVDSTGPRRVRVPQDTIAQMVSRLGTVEKK